MHSGGKSIHGWFDVRNEPEAAVEKFFKYAVSLGADRATWTSSQGCGSKLSHCPAQLTLPFLKGIPNW